jgi:glycosyltransferase involved in cell wall biosynthesis
VLEKYSRAHPEIITLFHEKNRGKWGAIRTALEKVTGDYTIIHDADSEYDTADFLPMIELIESRNAKVVYGSRRLGDNKQYSHFSFLLWGIFLSHLTNILYGQKITDEPTCYKLVSTKILKDMHLVCERFEFCPEVTAKLSRMGETIHEVPIKYYPRSIEQGKKIRWKDGIEAIITLLRYRFWKP